MEAILRAAKTKDKTWLSVNTVVMTGRTQSGNRDGNHLLPTGLELWRLEESCGGISTPQPGTPAESITTLSFVQMSSQIVNVCVCLCARVCVCVWVSSFLCAHKSTKYTHVLYLGSRVSSSLLSPCYVCQALRPKSIITSWNDNSFPQM